MEISIKTTADLGAAISEVVPSALAAAALLDPVVTTSTDPDKEEADTKAPKEIMEEISVKEDKDNSARTTTTKGEDLAKEAEITEGPKCSTTIGLTTGQDSTNLASPEAIIIIIGPSTGRDCMSQVSPEIIGPIMMKNAGKDLPIKT